MSRSFTLTRSAARDLDEILEFVLRSSGPARALRVHKRICDALRKLASHPGIGHARADLTDESLRVWPVFSYLVIYRPATSPLEVVRVLHGARPGYFTSGRASARSNGLRAL